MGLGTHLETKATLDPKQAMEWPTTEAGKSFIARISEDWARASIAAGPAEQAARAAAGRTTAFYTGQG